MSTPPSATLRQTMVDTQLKTVGVTDAAVLAAFADTPREPFLPAALASLAHADAAHEVVRGRFLLAPLALALLLQHAAVNRASGRWWWAAPRAIRPPSWPTWALRSRHWKAMPP